MNNIPGQILLTTPLKRNYQGCRQKFLKMPFLKMLANMQILWYN